MFLFIFFTGVCCARKRTKIMQTNHHVENLFWDEGHACMHIQELFNLKNCTRELAWTIIRKSQIWKIKRIHVILLFFKGAPCTKQRTNINGNGVLELVRGRPGRLSACFLIIVWPNKRPVSLRIDKPPVLIPRHENTPFTRERPLVLTPSIEKVLFIRERPLVRLFPNLIVSPNKRPVVASLAACWAKN